MTQMPGGGHTHLDGFIWSFVLLAIAGGTVLAIGLQAPHGFNDVWGVLLRPIPLTKIL
jgi:hypothetical protein